MTAKYTIVNDFISVQTLLSVHLFTGLFYKTVSDPLQAQTTILCGRSVLSDYKPKKGAQSQLGYRNDKD